MEDDGATPEWLRKLTRDIVKQRPSEASEHTILLIPDSLLGTSPSHFEPKTLHLGLHKRKPYSAGSDGFKVAIAQALLPEKGSAREEAWKQLVSKVVSSPEDVRMQYEPAGGDTEAGFLDVAALDDGAVASILTLDAIFVVAFLQVSAGVCQIPSWEVTFREPPLWASLNQMETELTIVPNQVPLSCLKEAVRVILETVEPRPTEGKVIEDLEVLLRHAVLLLYPLGHDHTLLRFMESRYTGINSLVGCKHILDCLYRVFSETLSEEGEARSVEETLTVDVEPLEAKTTRGRPLKFLLLKASKAPGLHFLRTKLTPANLTAGEGHAAVMEPSRPVLSAERLQMSGVEIRSKPCRLSDISFVSRSFSNSLLVLPQLQLYDTTAAELRNLAVYEFLAYPWNGHVRKYMRFMNDLISTTADAQLVVRSGAVANYVGGCDEMVSIWSGLNRGITLPVSDPTATLERVEAAIQSHCRQVSSRFLADMRSNLFGHPTVSFAVAFALILLLLTAAQTYVAFVTARRLHP